MAEVDGRYLGLRRVSAVLTLIALCAWCFLFGVSVVRGASMRPALAPGDVVVYRRGATGVNEGDVVLFAKVGWSGGVLHRVVSVQPNGSLKTRGDANERVDADVVERSRIRGVMVAVLPVGRVWHRVRTVISDMLHSSTNRMMRRDDGEASGTCVPSGTEPHGLEGFREHAERFTPSAAT